MKIIDNFLEKDLIKYLEKVFVFETPHYYGHHSTSSSNLFYVSEININDFLVKYIIIKLQQHFSFKEILKSYLNIQYSGMNGEWHQDEGDNTILLMVTKTLEKKSGQFQIKNKINEIDEVNFVQNRVLMFDANKMHRGLSPKEINTPRITWVFKVI